MYNSLTIHNNNAIVFSVNVDGNCSKLNTYQVEWLLHIFLKKLNDNMHCNSKFICVVVSAYLQIFFL